MGAIVVSVMNIVGPLIAKLIQSAIDARNLTTEELAALDKDLANDMEEVRKRVLMIDQAQDARNKAAADAVAAKFDSGL